MSVYWTFLDSKKLYNEVKTLLDYEMFCTDMELKVGWWKQKRGNKTGSEAYMQKSGMCSKWFDSKHRVRPGYDILLGA